MNVPNRSTRTCLILLCFAAVGAPAQTFTTLASFNENSGCRPMYGTLAQGFDGNFYGTTSLDGGGRPPAERRRGV
jgi:hypothetical protein